MDLPISLPCRGPPAVLLPIAPQSPIAATAAAAAAATAVHRDLYAAHRDRAALSPFIAPPLPLLSSNRIVPPPSLSPILTPTTAHCRRHHHCPLIALRRQSHAATHPPLSNLTACQGACW
jgi:hypothetical protein